MTKRPGKRELREELSAREYLVGPNGQAAAERAGYEVAA